MNENESPLLNKTRAAAGWTNDTGPLSADDFEESNKMHSMNGFVFCNAPNMSAPFGRKCGPTLPPAIASSPLPLVSVPPSAYEWLRAAMLRVQGLPRAK